MSMLFCDIKNYFMNSSVFERVFKLIQMTGLLLVIKRKYSHASICIRMLETEERGKAYRGKKTSFLTAVTGYRVSVI